jgi:hypothetical protein
MKSSFNYKKQLAIWRFQEDVMINLVKITQKVNSLPRTECWYILVQVCITLSHSMVQVMQGCKAYQVHFPTQQMAHYLDF